MIPKFIHYCWLGNNKKSELIEKCINSWKKYYPEYEIIEWNDSNIDILENQYSKEAYEAKKYAFVSDYVRLKVLYEYGGIYFDTDVEVLNRDNSLESYDFVVGFEASNRIGSAVVMANKHNPIIYEWLSYYNNRHFIDEMGKCDFTPNVWKITEILKQRGFEINGMKQVNDNCVICDVDMFYPYSIGEKDITFKNSVMVHWCDGSWVSGNIKIKHQLIILIKRLIGSKNYKSIKKIKDKLGIKRI